MENLNQSTELKSQIHEDFKSYNIIIDDFESHKYDLNVLTEYK